jgi:hypothetical protein
VEKIPGKLTSRTEPRHIVQMSYDQMSATTKPAQEWMEVMFAGIDVTKAARLTVLILVLAGGGWGQNFLAVQVKGRQRWQGDEVDKVYLSACSAVQSEFGVKRPVRPQITLILGAEKDEAAIDKREIRLVKWNPYLFAQGVVAFAFGDLMSTDDRLTMARRAVNWATSTIEIRDIEK